MHGDREGRSSTISSQSILNNDTHTNTSTLIESACLPIGCSVSAKYRGAFCSAQVKTVDRDVKLKVIVLNTNEILTISEAQIVQPAILRLGSKVTIRLPLSNRLDTTSHLSRSSLAAIINAHNNYEEKQATIKQIYDNSTYTVVFNDGDEKSLRRSSLCLQGIRLYQTQIGQQKLLDDIPTSTLSLNSNTITSIVAVRRNGNQNQHAFPALILKRKSLADYIWIRSFLDGREYIVHKRDDVHSYKSDSDIQSLCRSTSKQATRACEQFIKYNQIPVIWQKKKKKVINNEENNASNTSDNDTNTSDTDVDDSDEETMEEKDSFVAQLFAFMEDRGTPINNITKVHNYDLDLHRLFKIVRTLGGYNKVTKNDQWSKVYIKMGLPDESIPKNNRLIENAYKKYLFAYEDLSKKLGTMNAPNAYFGGRTGLCNDSRRSLVRVRQQSNNKNKSKQIPTSNKRQSLKRQSIESKAAISNIKTRGKTTGINKIRSTNVLTTSTSESEISDDETMISSSSSSNNNKRQNQRITKSKKYNNTHLKKSSISSDETKQISSSIANSQSTHERSNLVSIKKSKSTVDSENDMKPIIKIPKISYELLKESTLATHKFHKKETTTKPFKVQYNTSIKQDTSDQEQSKPHILFCQSTNQNILDDLTPLPVTPVSPSPPPSVNNQLSLLSTNIQNSNNSNEEIPAEVLETSSIFQTIISSSMTHQPTNDIENLSSNTNKRSYSDENSDYNDKIDEQLSPSKRSRHSISSLDSIETISNNKQSMTSNASVNNCNVSLTYEDILVNDILLIKQDFNQKKQYDARCIKKNDNNKELLVHYQGMDSKYDEWIDSGRVIKRLNDLDSNEEETIDNISLSSISTEERNRKMDEHQIVSNNQDNGIWQTLEIVSMNKSDIVLCTSTIRTNQEFHSFDQTTDFQRTTSVNSKKNIITIDISSAVESTDDNESNHNDDHIQEKISPKHLSLPTESIQLEDISSMSAVLLDPLYSKEEIIDNSSNNQQTTCTLIDSSLPSIIQPNSPNDNRRTSTRQSKRRTFRDSKDSSISIKKRTRWDTDINSNYTVDNSDHISIPNEQQSSELKRCRTVGKRGGKRTVNQPVLDNENEDFPINSLVNITLRQQLEDMFKNRSSRYNFLDLNNDLTGDNRLNHLKDRMRQCQKVFSNLKSALTKIEKQRKLFIQRQKVLITQATTNDLLLPSTCT